MEVQRITLFTITAVACDRHTWPKCIQKESNVYLDVRHVMILDFCTYVKGGLLRWGLTRLLTSIQQLYVGNYIGLLVCLTDELRGGTTAL